MHASSEPALSPVPLPRVARAMVAGLRLVRAHRVLNPAAFEESWRERGGYAVDPDHRPHVVAELDWLARAQDATGAGGVARGYSLGWNPAFGPRAWQPADPGATGDIIPVLYVAARHLHRPELAERAEQAARWELELQLPSGAVRRGVVGERTASATFTTGRVLLAWLAAFGETGGGRGSGGGAGGSSPAPRVAPRGSCSPRWARTACGARASRRRRPGQPHCAMRAQHGPSRRRDGVYGRPNSLPPRRRPFGRWRG